ELTPPGISDWARVNRAWDLSWFMAWKIPVSCIGRSCRCVGGGECRGIGPRGGSGIGRVEDAADHGEVVGTGVDQRLRIVGRDAADGHAGQAETGGVAQQVWRGATRMGLGRGREERTEG